MTRDEIEAAAVGYVICYRPRDGYPVSAVSDEHVYDNPPFKPWVSKNEAIFALVPVPEEG